MTLDEAIEYYINVATKRAVADEGMGVNDKWHETKFMTKKESEQIIADNRQLAEWLRELKGHRESDTQPLVHAYWIRGKEYGFRTHNPMWYCSNCGGGIRYDTTLRTYQKQKRPVQEVNCFCRKCGAKMDLEPIYEREETNNENH